MKKIIALGVLILGCDSQAGLWSGNMFGCTQRKVECHNGTVVPLDYAYARGQHVNNVLKPGITVDMTGEFMEWDAKLQTTKPVKKTEYVSLEKFSFLKHPNMHCYPMTQNAGATLSQVFTACQGIEPRQSGAKIFSGVKEVKNAYVPPQAHPHSRAHM